MGEVIRRVETRRAGRATGEEKDPLGNVMVESIQQLSGLNKSKKKVKPKKPTSLSLGKGRQKKIKKVKGKQAKKNAVNTLKTDVTKTAG